MTSTDPNNQADENVLAYAAITLCGNPSQGPTPQLQEIAAWRQGTLSSHRSTEILSHVANDPACFQHWLDIVEAQRWVDEETGSASDTQNAAHSAATHTNSVPPNTPSSDNEATSTVISQGIQAIRGLFQQPLPIYGGAFSALILAVLIAPMLRTGDSFTLQQQLDRNTDAYIARGSGLIGTPPLRRNTRSLGTLFDKLSVSDVERQHFQNGLQTFYQKLQASDDTQNTANTAWERWLTELPVDNVDCTIAQDPTHCSAVADEFVWLGQWAFTTTATCELVAEQGIASLKSTAWKEQYSTYERLRTLPNVAQSAFFAPWLPALETKTPDALCAIAGSVMAVGQ